ncbi:hypothetical protein ACLKA6_003752 [Drosophila palustris]
MSIDAAQLNEILQSLAGAIRTAVEQGSHNAGNSENSTMTPRFAMPNYKSGEEITVTDYFTSKLINFQLQLPPFLEKQKKMITWVESYKPWRAVAAYLEADLKHRKPNTTCHRDALFSNTAWSFLSSFNNEFWMNYTKRIWE